MDSQFLPLEFRTMGGMEGTVPREEVGADSGRSHVSTSLCVKLEY